MIKVSIIMPSLNVVGYIEQCIKSVVEQTLRDIEIICVDAGSTDGTLEILEKYAYNDRRVHIIKSDKKSYGYQVNLGIKHSAGRYVGIVETDDFIDCNMYERLYEIAEVNGADIVKGDWRYVLPVRDDEIFIRSNTFNKADNIYGKIIKASEYPEIFMRDATVWKGIYRREFLINKSIFFNESPGAAYQDCGFMPIVLAKAESIYYTDEAFYNYRYGRPGCSSVNPNVLKYAFQEWKRLLEGALDVFALPYCSYVIERMVDVFICEFEKSICIQNYNYESDFVKPYYNWFSDTIIDILSQYELPCQKNDEAKWRKLQLLLKNVEEYSYQLSMENRTQSECRNEMLSRIQKHEVVIFGCGNYGLRTYEFFENNNIQVKAFCDNNSSMWGKMVLKTPIISPDDAVRIYDDTVYIVANKKSADVIVKQLIGYGISEKNIIIMNCLSKI